MTPGNTAEQTCSTVRPNVVCNTSDNPVLHTTNEDKTEPITDEHNMANSTITVHNTPLTTTVHTNATP